MDLDQLLIELCSPNKREILLEELGLDSFGTHEFHFWCKFFQYYDTTGDLHREYMSQCANGGPVSWYFVLEAEFSILNRTCEMNDYTFSSEDDSPNAMYFEMLNFVLDKIGDSELRKSSNQNERIHQLNILLKLTGVVAIEKKNENLDDNHKMKVLKQWLYVHRAIMKEMEYCRERQRLDEEKARRDTLTRNILTFATIGLITSSILLYNRKYW